MIIWRNAVFEEQVFPWKVKYQGKQMPRAEVLKACQGETYLDILSIESREIEVVTEQWMVGEEGEISQGTVMSESPLGMKLVMEVEMEGMRNNVWEIVDTPNNARVIGSKWVFSLKYDTDGKVVKHHKARLVAQGFREHMDLGAEVTFILVKRKIMRLPIRVAVEKHLDVTNAYLHSQISGVVFMEQLELFAELNAQNYASDSTSNYVKSEIVKLLRDFSTYDCKPSKTVLPIGCTATEEEEQKFDGTIYRSAVGNPLYFSNNTRPDITFAVSEVIQKCQVPKIMDWNVTKYIIRYLKCTRNMKLCFKGGRLSARICCDADWGGDTESRKLVNGYTVVLSGGAVSWYSKKQNCIARSTMEAEYMAMAQVSREIIWMRDLLVELGVEGFMSTPCVIFADNAAAIKRSKSVNVELTEKKKVIEFEHKVSERNAADLFTENVAGINIQPFSKIIGLE
ncbi:hypothetical protein PR048_005406 [Dryococelus australis]|uniref:Reverse transcriptase Ty1/copia-type domain-containing protein n=1 Tax=Dryococelus australis TaxID=614101 RepID=A0ABQ9I989_9NEOP|nr:hypothetical protein PR048_005406 [Dryococelus australis]